MVKQEFYNFKKLHSIDRTVETDWIVITGPPSSGKTTLIEKMAEKGYEVLHDIAREIIVEMKQKSKPVDERTKQLLIVKRQLEKYLDTSITRGKNQS